MMDRTPTPTPIPTPTQMPIRETNMARGRQTGRIHLHQRNTDDVTQVIGADNAITAEHADDIIVTEQRAMENETCKDYRLRIARIYKWWMEHYPD